MQMDQPNWEFMQRPEKSYVGMVVTLSDNVGTYQMRRLRFQQNLITMLSELKREKTSEPLRGFLSSES